MKKVLISAGMVVLSAAAGFAFDIPRGVFEIAELEKARQTAAEKEDPVVFLISRKSLKPT